jgi:hypothetical protein
MNAISLFMLFVFPKFFLSKLRLTDESVCILENHYDVLVSQSQLYASLFRRINKNAEVYFIEDGLSSYTSRTVDPLSRSIYFRLADKIFFHRNLLSDVKMQLLYVPKMYLGDIGSTKQLPVRNPENNIFYNRIFEYKDNAIYDSHKFVYLGAVYKELNNLTLNPNNVSNDLEDKCRFIVDGAMKVPKKNSFVYRAHPLENIDEDHYKEFCEFDTCNNMWEIECQNTITNNHVLVSFFSTASFTPKMLYGKEPYVIFLYKILDVEFFNACKLVYSLQAIYSNPQKIILVENLDELFTVIEKLDLLQKCDNFTEEL